LRKLLALSTSGTRLVPGLLAGLLLAACAAPDTPILPGKLDLPVAAGDRWKLCADDGLEDTTPDADCVLATLADPMAGYVAALEALGWRKVETMQTGETWTRNGSPCGVLNVSGVRETYARKDYTLLRFEVSCAAT
jgi:hypothetical protein